MKGLCVTLLLCLVAYLVQGKSLQQQVDGDITNVQKIVAKLREMRRRNILSDSCIRERWDIGQDTFEQCKADVEEHCEDQSVESFCHHDEEKVDMNQLTELMQHLSKLSEQANKTVSESSQQTHHLEHFFYDIESFEAHFDLAHMFTNTLEGLAEESFCTFAPLGPMLYRMEFYGIQGVAACDNMEKVYRRLKNEQTSWVNPCDDVQYVVTQLSEAFKSDVRCFSEDVHSFHEMVLNVIEALKELEKEVEKKDVVMKQNELMMYVAGMGEGVRRLYVDGSFMHCGISEVIGMLQDYCFCDFEFDEKKEIREEKSEMKELLDALKDLSNM